MQTKWNHVLFTRVYFGFHWNSNEHQMGSLGAHSNSNKKMIPQVFGDHQMNIICFPKLSLNFWWKSHVSSGFHEHSNDHNMLSLGCYWNSHANNVFSLGFHWRSNGHHVCSHVSLDFHWHFSGNQIICWRFHGNSDERYMCP